MHADLAQHGSAHLIGKRGGGSGGKVLFDLCTGGVVDDDLRREKSRGGDELEGRVANELPREPQERFLEVVLRVRSD